MNSSIFKQIEKQNVANIVMHTSLNQCLGSVVLAIKVGADPNMKTTGTPAYMMNGQLGALTAQATVATAPIAAKVIPATMQALIAVFTDNAGTFSVDMGPVVAQTQSVLVNGVATTVAINPNLPDYADTKLCVGCVKVVNNSAANFVPGTTALDAANIATTYYNLGAAFPQMYMANV